MRKPLGELTIEPDPLPEPVTVNYEQLLHAELANVAPNAGATSLKLANMALIYLYADYGEHSTGATYGLRAEVCDDASTRFKELDARKRDALAWEVKHAMARQSLLPVTPDEDPINYAEYYHESRVFMDNQPILFEPFSHAMLMGSWDKRRQNKLKFEALDIPTHEQRLILLGGFATFLNFLKQ